MINLLCSQIDTQTCILWCIVAILHNVLIGILCIRECFVFLYAKR